MADAPRILGVPMKQLVNHKPWWGAAGVWLALNDRGNWEWSVSINGSEPVANGITKGHWAACCQIERAITRIREAAGKLGT